MPLIALRNVAVLPGMLVHFDVNRKISIQAIEQAMKSDQMIFAVMQRDAAVEEPTSDDLYPVGCVARIKQIIKLPGNLVRVLITGEQRGELDMTQIVEVIRQIAERNTCTRCAVIGILIHALIQRGQRFINARIDQLNHFDIVISAVFKKNAAQ